MGNVLHLCLSVCLSQVKNKWMEFDEIYRVVYILYHTPIQKCPKNVTDKFLMCEQR